MTWQEIQKAIKKEFGDRILKWTEHNKKRVYVDIAPENLVDCAKILFEDMGSRFIIATGLDTPRGGVEILYHFDFFQQPQVLSLRVFVKKPDLTVDSISRVVKGAEWIEREIKELLGITFKNHPNPEHLLLPHDWPEGKYPLRRDQ